MRSPIIAFMLLGLLVAGQLKAQTWEHPLPLYYESSHVYSENTCPFDNTIQFIDGAYFPGPDIVYEFKNRRPVGMPLFTDALITLVPNPNSTFEPIDFEVFACEQKYGITVQNCPAEWDNLYRLGQWFQITIPPQYKTLHIVVTAGNLLPISYNPCIGYQLYVQRF
jgi:hypothetical protein